MGNGKAVANTTVHTDDQSGVEHRRFSVNTVAATPVGMTTEEGGLEVDYFRFMSQSFHEGKIMGLDVCSRKPLIATCATDHTVRIWNFETK